MEKKYHSAIVACARWEENYIVEWVEYYKCIGYDHIYLYCNDEDPKPLYDKIFPFVIGKDPYVTFVHFEYQGLQYQMYMHFIMHYLAETEWVSFFDIDEFLRINDGRLIDQFLESFSSDIDCILFNWLVFGTSGHKIAPSGKVLENYTRTSGQINQYTKFICRASILNDGKLTIPDFAIGFWHNLEDKLYKDIKIVNVLGETTNNMKFYDDATSKRINQVAALHHYIMKSEEYALHRIARGTAGEFFGQTIWNTTIQEGRRALSELDQFDITEDTSLVDFWTEQRMKVASTRLAPTPKGQLISQNASCRQSSLSKWSLGDNIFTDARGATNGIINGREKFHTEIELNPWWQIDFTRNVMATEIIIYNVSSHTQSRFKNFEVLVSQNDNEWFKIFSKNDGIKVGSLITQPFILELRPHLICRHIRIVLLGKDYLHLDQVEVYGKFLEDIVNS